MVEYRIVVRNLVLVARIGVHPHEKARPPRLRIGVELDMATPAPSRDELAAVLNYEQLVAGIKAIAAGEHINLVETFAERVMRLCFCDPRVAGVRISVEKLEVYVEAESIGVVLERRR
jgi:dihydroneopterin aldolase